MGHQNNMSVRITSVAKQLPQYSRTTAEIIPYVKAWMSGHEERFQRKVLKIFENAGVDIRYSIMDAHEVFTASSFEERNDIYAREAVNIAEQALTKALDKGIEIREIVLDRKSGGKSGEFRRSGRKH